MCSSHEMPFVITTLVYRVYPSICKTENTALFLARRLEYDKLPMLMIK